MAVSEYYNQVYKMFVTYFGRPPAESGLDYYAGLLDENGGDLAVIVDDFYNSDESAAFFDGKSVEGQVNQVFQNAFGRDAEVDGLNYWANEVRTGEIAVSQLAATVAFNADEADTAILDAKVDTAEEWVADLDTATKILEYQTDAGKEGAREFLSSVDTDTPATAEEVAAGVTEALSGTNVNPGDTFTLTTNIDTGSAFTGTDGDDEFVGTVVASNDAAPTLTGTLQAGDVISGGQGEGDRLNVTVSGGGGSVANNIGAPGADVEGIEEVYVRNVADLQGNVINVDATGLADAQQVWSDRSSEGVAVTNLATGATAGVKGDGSNVVFNFGYATAADDASLAIADGVAGGAITVTSDPVNVSISSTGAANTTGAIDLSNSASVEAVTVNAAADLTVGGAFGSNADYASGADITIEGAGAVDLSNTALDTDIDSVDASSNSGGVTFEVGDGGVAVTGGSGDDVVDLAAVAQTEDVDLGEGTDTVIFSGSGNYNATAARVSNAEVLRADANGTFDVSRISGLESLQASDTGNTGNIVFSEVGASTPIRVINNIANNSLDINLADVSGATDSVDLTIDDINDTAAAITVGAVEVAGVETLNVTTADGLDAGTAHVISALTNSTDLETVSVTGDSDLTITDATAPTGELTIDATGFSNALTVGADGTSGISAGDNVTGGAGDDSLFVAHGSLGTTTEFSGGAGDDTLNVDGDGSTVVDGDFAAITGIENLTILSETTTDVTLGGFAQGAIQSIDGNLDISAVELTDDSSIDASALTSTGADIDVKVVGDGNDAALTLSGGAQADTFVVELDDSGAGQAVTASVTGGDGIDTIDYTLTGGQGTDDVVTAVTGTTEVANADIISGFTGGDAQSLIDYNGTVQGTVNTDVTTNATLNGAFGTTGESAYVQTNDIANSNSNTQGDAFTALLGSDADDLESNYSALETQLLAEDGALNGTFANLDSAISNGSSALLALDDGTGTALLRITNDTSTANTIEADEIDLVGVLTDTTGLTADDLA